MADRLRGIMVRHCAREMRPVDFLKLNHLYSGGYKHRFKDTTRWDQSIIAKIREEFGIRPP